MLELVPEALARKVRRLSSLPLRRLPTRCCEVAVRGARAPRVGFGPFCSRKPVGAILKRQNMRWFSRFLLKQVAAGSWVSRIRRSVGRRGEALPSGTRVDLGAISIFAQSRCWRGWFCSMCEKRRSFAGSTCTVSAVGCGAPGLADVVEIWSGTCRTRAAAPEQHNPLPSLFSLVERIGF